MTKISILNQGNVIRQTTTSTALKTNKISRQLDEGVSDFCISNKLPRYPHQSASITKPLLEQDIGEQCRRFLGVGVLQTVKRLTT